MKNLVHYVYFWAAIAKNKFGAPAWQHSHSQYCESLLWLSAELRRMFLISLTAMFCIVTILINLCHLQSLQIMSPDKLEILCLSECCSVKKKGKNFEEFIQPASVNPTRTRYTTWYRFSLLLPSLVFSQITKWKCVMERGNLTHFADVDGYLVRFCINSGQWKGKLNSSGKAVVIPPCNGWAYW